MTRFRRFTTELDHWMTQFGAARDCVAAVESGRRPPERALKTLGIHPKAFDPIV